MDRRDELNELGATGATAGAATVLPRRHDAVEVAEFETEFVVLETRSRQVHLLGPLASLVFDACDGTTTQDALVDEIAEWSPDDRDSIAAAVAATLGELGGLGLFEGTRPAPPPPPCVGCGRVVEPEVPRSRPFWRRNAHS